MDTHRMHSKNLEIERLRAIAVLLVVYAHAPFNQLFTRYLYSTFTGVDLFFVISGFVVSRSFMRSLPDIRGLDLTARFAACKTQVAAFYLRRLFRILPSASLYVTILFAASILLRRDGSLAPFAHPENVFREIVAIYSGVYNYALAAGAVTENLAPYWTLAVEEHFYMIAPVLLIAFARPAHRIAALLAGIAIVLVVFRPMTAGNIINVSHTRFDALFYGVLIAVIFEHRSGLKSAASRIRLPAVLASTQLRTVLKSAFVFGACAVLALLPGVTNTALLNGTTGPNFDTSSTALLSYDGVAVVLVLLATLEHGWIFDIPLLRSVLEYIGSRSYALYLAHWVIVQTYNDLFFRYYEHIPHFLKLTRVGYEIQFALYIAAALLLAELSYRIVETPFIRMGRALLSSSRLPNTSAGLAKSEAG